MCQEIVQLKLHEMKSKPVFKLGSEIWTVEKENNVETLESQQIKFMRHLWVPQGQIIFTEKVMKAVGRK